MPLFGCFAYLNLRLLRHSSLCSRSSRCRAPIFAQSTWHLSVQAVLLAAVTLIGLCIALAVEAGVEPRQSVRSAVSICDEGP